MVNKKNQNKKKQNKGPAPKRAPVFGPVSAINTAPVSVGNSVRGSKPRISQSVDGARVVGRDFAFALSSSAAAVTGWEVIGGMPLTPCAFPSSILRNYCQMFAKFKVNKCTIHYITSSPTSQAGDILFYYERDRLAPFPDYSNSSFLPFVLSDDHTIIGPQWTNHTMQIRPVPEWKSTLYGNQTDINEDAAGSYFLFSKTNAANSPGYLLIDYDISFKEMAVNPRAGTLPIARAQSTFMANQLTATAITAGDTLVFNSLVAAKTIANATSALPTGVLAGDIYKLVMQVTASTLVNAAWTNVTTATLMRYNDNTTITVDDGFTCYASYDGITFTLYPTLENAVTRTGNLEFGVTATITYSLCFEAQLVRNVDALTQSSY
jgi:hypothetical protein